MTKLIYIYDTLCGWCFVAQPEILKLYKALPDGVDFESHHAHLFTDENPFPLNAQTFEMIENVAKVEGPNRTGAQMSDAYLNFIRTEGLVHSSTLSALAAAAADQLDPSKSFMFEMAYQAKIFKQGADFRDPEVVISTWADMGGNGDAMRETLLDKNLAKLQRKQKQKAIKMLQMIGARGTPTLILEQDGEIMPVDPFSTEQIIPFLNTH